jgi:hypothetical protein
LQRKGELQTEGKEHLGRPQNAWGLIILMVMKNMVRGCGADLFKYSEEGGS